jgi:ABC-type glutathione transport system ATPase component
MVKVDGLKKYFQSRSAGFLGKPGVVRAVDGVSFSIEKGKTLGLVGESGSGKTTSARSALRLIEPDAGSVCVGDTEVTALKGEALRLFRRNMQIVFQDPFGSLNPRMTVGSIVSEPLRIHEKMSRGELRDREAGLLRQVGLDPSLAGAIPTSSAVASASVSASRAPLP